MLTPELKNQPRTLAPGASAGVTRIVTDFYIYALN